MHGEVGEACSEAGSSKPHSTAVLSVRAGLFPETESPLVVAEGRKGNLLAYGIQKFVSRSGPTDFSGKLSSLG